MATQTILFPSPEGETLNLELRAIGASSTTATATATEVSPGRYAAEFTDVAAATYVYTAVRDSDDSAVMTDTVTLEAETGFYLGTSESIAGSGGLTTGQSDQLADIYAKVQSTPISTYSSRPEPGLIEVTRDVDYHDGSPAGEIDLPIDSGIDLTDITATLAVSDRDENVLFTNTATVKDLGQSTQRLACEIDKADTVNLELGAIYSYVWTVDFPGGERWKPEDGVFDLGGDVRT